MWGRKESLTHALKKYDDKLYFDKNMEGKLCLYRKNYRPERYHLEDNVYLTFLRPSPDLVFALTHNWQLGGEEVEWGYMPILERLKSIDLQKRDLVADIFENYEKNEKQNERKLKNSNEDFLREKKHVFQKAFEDINVSNMSMRPKKTKYDLKGY